MGFLREAAFWFRHPVIAAETELIKFFTPLVYIGEDAPGFPVHPDAALGLPTSEAAQMLGLIEVGLVKTTTVRRPGARGGKPE